MGKEQDRIQPKNELSADDKMHITQVFYDDIEPRLMRMQARVGTINCEFSGKQYKNWVIEFRSTRSGFEITGFEYDENSRSYDLSSLPQIPQIDKNV